MSNLKTGTGKAARKLPDGAKEVLQDFVVAVLRSKVTKEHFAKFAADWFAKLLHDEERESSKVVKVSVVEDEPTVNTVSSNEPAASQPATADNLPPESIRASVAGVVQQPSTVDLGTVQALSIADVGTVQLASTVDVGAAPQRSTLNFGRTLEQPSSANLEHAQGEGLNPQPFTLGDQSTSQPLIEKFSTLGDAPDSGVHEAPSAALPTPEEQIPPVPQLSSHEMPSPADAPPAVQPVEPPVSEPTEPAPSDIPPASSTIEEQRGSTDRRQAVSAESYDPTAPSTELEVIKSFPKSVEQLIRVKEAVRDVLLFRSLDDEHLLKVIEALEEIDVDEGQEVITEGDEQADFFYVVNNGEFECFMNTEKVTEYINKGSFGELALMYSQPRAATVKARTAGQLWRLDRETFKKIVIRGANEKRQLYMSLLETVDFIAGLQSYEKQNVCDALTGKVYSSGEVVMRQGDTGDGMYFVEAGEVTCMRSEEGADKEIGKAGPGEYVGELALICSQPRAATVTATMDNTKLAFLDARAFERLMGPCVDILKRNKEKYRDRMVAAFGENHAKTFLQ